MSRHFRLEEAERLLPDVERALREAIAHKDEYQAAESELHSSMERIRMSGGSRVNPGPILALRVRKDSATKALTAAVERVEELGAQIKVLDIGLIDFPALYHGREVLLCWKLGEDGIAFWHGADEGFRGRKPIDDDFREHHRGNSPN